MSDFKDAVRDVTLGLAQRVLEHQMRFIRAQNEATRAAYDNLSDAERWESAVREDVERGRLGLMRVTASDLAGDPGLLEEMRPAPGDD